MVNRINILLVILVSVFFCACDTTVESEATGAGTCVPVMEHDEFVILCWYELVDISADVLLDEYNSPDAEWRLNKLKEAGFTTYYDYRLDSYDDAEALLSMGDRVGMDIIVDCPELHEEIMTPMIVEAMSAHPSLYAYAVWDEPETSEYAEVVRRIKEIYKYDKMRPCYVNLYPNYGLDEWTEDNYLNTVRHFLKSVPVSFLSFDYYPVIMKDGEKVLRDAWYHNMEDIRLAASEAGAPIWAFAMSKALGSNPKPTLADLRLQQFTNLVYGAVAFQYFTARGIVWDDAVTDVYQYVKQVNHELKQMEDIFLGADIKGIWHTGKDIPRGTKPLVKFPDGISRLETGDAGAVVSYFMNKGNRYIAILNRSCTDPMNFMIEFEADALQISKDGSANEVDESYTIDAGDIMLFTWK